MYAQVIVAIIAYIIILASQIVFIFSPNSWPVGFSVKLIIVNVIFSVIGVYSIYCMVAGNCHIFSWIIVVLLVLFSILIVIITVIMFRVVTKAQDSLDRLDNQKNQRPTLA